LFVFVGFKDAKLQKSVKMTKKWDENLQK